MNRKRFLFFLSILFCIILIPVFVLIFRQPKTETSILTASSQEDIHQFYYSAVPGLKMAEDAGLVREVNKRLDWPGKNTAIYIDDIWYNMKSVFLFYHVEEFPSAAYLGGELYVPANEPVEKQAFHGTASIGSTTEKGIIYKEDYYSCLHLSSIQDSSEKYISELDTVYYTPYINVPSHEGKDIIESAQLKSFEIPLNYNAEEETETIIPLDSQLELEEKKLHFYQANISPSKLKFYFQYMNSGKDQVYRVCGSYITDKGETHSFDVYPNVITEYPYHYTIEVPSLHLIPDTIQMKIDSIFCVGKDEMDFEIETSKFTGKNRSWDTEIGKDQIKGTQILIKNIDVNPQLVKVFIACISDTEKPAAAEINLYPTNSNWIRKDETYTNLPNQLIIQDADFEQYETDIYSYGIETIPGEGIRICLDRQFWDATSKVHLKLKNLTYQYKINKSLPLKLSLDNSTK